MKLITLLITVMCMVFMVDTVYAFSTETCGPSALVEMMPILGNPTYKACTDASGMNFLQLFGKNVAEAHVNAKEMCRQRECKIFMQELIAPGSPVGDCVVSIGLPYPVNCLELITALAKDCN